MGIDLDDYDCSAGRPKPAKKAPKPAAKKGGNKGKGKSGGKSSGGGKGKGSKGGNGGGGGGSGGTTGAANSNPGSGGGKRGKPPPNEGGSVLKQQFRANMEKRKTNLRKDHHLGEVYLFFLFCFVPTKHSFQGEMVSSDTPITQPSNRG